MTSKACAPNSMRIAQVCPRYYPYMGGVETVVKNTSEKLVGRGFTVEVLTHDPSVKSLATETVNGVVVRRFRPGPMGLDFPFRRGTLRGYLKAHAADYDLVHAHSYHAFPALYAAWAKGTNKLVVSPHYHGKGHNPFMSLLHIPYRLAGKAMFERADRIICVSEFEKRLVEKHFSAMPQSIVVVPNGVAADEISGMPPFAFDGKLVVYVGRLEKYKNIDVAIRAMPHLSPEYRLMIIGEGPYRTRLLKLVEHYGLGDRVRLESGLSNEDVYRWYRTCNVVINFSSQEAFGINVIEALAAGKPVIVNNGMALPELATRFNNVHVVDAGLLSPQQIAQEIDRACVSSFDPTDLADYSWDSIVDRIGNYYLNC